jgi:23S rRNA pseudouridine1911/1915/1917 synthase
MSDTPLQFAVRPNPAVAVDIVHEDPDLLVINKPAGVVTQPGKGHATDSLLNGVFALRDGQMGKLLHNLGVRRDFGLLHRLDRDTSGLLVIAKSPGAYDQLRRDFESRHVDKEYLALTAGVPDPRQGVVQARLKEVQIPNPGGFGTIKKVVVSRQGQEAVSAYKVLAQSPETAAKSARGPAFPPFALVHVTIKTGRLHQIRAHMMFLNCQVLGDDLYAPPGGSFKNVPHPPRLCLHATRLGFKHPTTPAEGGSAKWIHFEAPLPPDLAAYAKKLALT